MATPVEALQIPVWIDLTAVVVGGTSGALVAVRQGLDFVGVLFLAVVMGLGGGVLRDVLLGVRPVALTDRAYLPTAAIAAVVGFFFATAVRRFGIVLHVLDAFALGLFMVVGVEKTLLFDLPAPSAVFIGVAAATGGGVLRDLLTNQPVEVVHRGPWNAAAALLGAVAYTSLHALGAASVVCEAVGVALCVGSRLLSVWRGWETPVAYDLTPVVVRPIRRALPESSPPWFAPGRRRRGDDKAQKPPVSE